MKRKGIIAILAMAMVMLSVAFCWAEGGALQVTSSYPENGQENTSMENLGIKVYFNGTFTNADVQAANKKCVKIVDEDGKKIPIDTLFSSSENGLVLVVADLNDSDYTVKNNHTYTLVLGENFADDNGNTLGKETKISFKTYNQKMSNIVNVVMMMAMFGAITFFMLRSKRDEDQPKEEVKEEKQGAFNPYKEAKRTGKTVEQVQAEEAKRQEKSAKKKSKKKTNEKQSKKKFICADYLNNVYHVHAPAPIHKAKKK